MGAWPVHQGRAGRSRAGPETKEVTTTAGRRAGREGDPGRTRQGGSPRTRAGDALGTSFHGTEATSHPTHALFENTAEFHLSVPFRWQFWLYRIKVTAENSCAPTLGSSVMDCP